MVVIARRQLSVFIVAAIFCAWLGGCVTQENIRYGPLPMARDLSTPITVMTFNIRLGLGQEEPDGVIYKMNWGRNLPAVIDAIRASDADIVALQEVAGVTQIRSIAEALNMNYAFAWHQTASSRKRWWGVGILSRFPITRSRSAEISWGRGNSRSILIASIATHQGTVSVFSIHKDKDLRDGASIRNILAEARAETNPVLLAGDFNVRPGDKRLNELKKTFVDTAPAAKSRPAQKAIERGTFFPSRKRIDYVFAQAVDFDVIGASLIADEHWHASDHIAYIAKLRIKK